MKGNRSSLLSVTAACLLMVVVALPALAQKASPVGKVDGGGTAAFVDPRFGDGATTQFAVGATVYSDGSANGVFECVIKGVLSWHIKATGGTVNGDGSITITGPSIVHFAGGGTLTMDAFIIFYNGGPGEGMFCAGPPTFPDTDCDVEIVTNGMIFVH